MEVGRGAGKGAKGVVTNRMCHIISLALKLMQGLRMKSEKARHATRRARDRKTLNENYKSIFVTRPTRTTRTPKRANEQRGVRLARIIGENGRDQPCNLRRPLRVIRPLPFSKMALLQQRVMW